MSAASPADYRDVTVQPPIASGAPQAPVAGPGGIAMVPYPTVGGPIYVSAKFDHCLWWVLYIALSVARFISHTLAAGPAKCTHVHAAARHTHYSARLYAQRLPTCDASGGDHLLYPQHHLNGDVTASSILFHLGMMSQYPQY